MIRYSIIAAVSRNGVIGDQGGLPWTIPQDLNYFKEKTMGKPCIVGRKTHESLPTLEGRTMFIVSRQAGYYTPLEAVESATRFAQNRKVKEVMIIGGAQIYHHLLEITDRMYLTRVNEDFDGDTYFPMWSRNEWVPTSSIKVRSKVPARFEIWDRYK